MQKSEESKIKKDWEKRGFSFGVWIDEPGQAWIDYIHDADELFMVVHGEIELTIGANVFHPKPYEEFFIPKSTKHSVKNIGKTEAQWLYGYRKI